jgi:hypothetical protein
MSRAVPIALVAALVGSAAADPATTSPMPTISMGAGKQVAVPTRADQFTPHAEVSPYIYLNRCMGGCTVTGAGLNDARNQQSSIPAAGSYTIGEFANKFGQTQTSGMGTCLNPDGSSASTPCANDAACASLGTGAVCDNADYEWAQVVQCMKEVYSPFAVTLTETPPTGGVSYTEAIIAGQPSDIGLDASILGIAPILCNSPQDNVISFSFANHHAAADRVNNICWTAAQETAHAFGLDHEYQFNDGMSACSDPMTYRTDCGGEKFFRNKFAQCGRYSTTDYTCNASQNSHQAILAVFGPGQSLIPPPTVSVSLPANGATVTKSWNTAAMAGSRRGVATLELWLNGYKWTSAPGAAFGAEGQPDPSNYSLVAPAAVPDGAMFIIVKAYDDLGEEADAAPIKVTLGAACTADSSCLTGQHCNTGADTSTVPSGGCYWDPPAGQMGDKCTYPQFCTSGVCDGPANGAICTTTCIVGTTDSCPAMYDCVQKSGTSGICYPTQSGGGCCQANGIDAALTHFGLGALVLGIVIRRRRRPCA